jgi:tetratricopeptide (TPR) repeat protein
MIIWKFGDLEIWKWATRCFTALASVATAQFSNLQISKVSNSRTVLLVLCLLSAQFSVAQSRDSLIVHFTDGVRLATEARYDEAIGEYQKALSLDPDHAPSLYELAGVLATLGRDAEAIGYSRRAAELDPDNRWYKSQQGALLVALERLDEALPLFEEMVADRRSFDPENFRMLAMLYYRKGRSDDALATLDSVEVRMGTTPELVGMKRGLLIDAGRIDDAVTVTEEYLRGAPYDEENRLALAEIYAYQRRDSLQEETLRELVLINLENDRALGALAELYYSRGQMELYFATLGHYFALSGVPLERKKEILGRLTTNINFYRNHFFEVGRLALSLVTGYPGDHGAVELYADHAVRGGDAEGALVILKGALSRPEPSLSTLLKTIEIEAWLERPDSVAVWSDRALALYPDEVQIYLLRASALQYLKRPREAQKTLARALRVATTDSLRSEIYGTIGTLWHEEGNLKKTFEAYEQALKYNSNNALVLNNYAYFLALEGRQLDRALGMAGRATKLQENFPTYLDTYAWVLYKTGDYTEARRVMGRALALDRDGSPEMMMHYGDILWAQGEKFMASVYWKRARDAGWEPASEIEERLARIE